MSDAQRVAGKVIVISGGSRGIGAAMAVAFACEGARLLVLGYEKESEERRATDARISKIGVPTIWVHGDVAEESTARRLCAEAMAEGGRLDVVVANAGVSHFAPFALASTEELRRVIGVNQLGVYYLLREAGRVMKKQAGGVALVVSSALTSQVQKMTVLYAATKAFVETLTKGFALEYADHGIRANVIAPGVTDTEMNRVTMGVSPDVIAARTTFGRLAKPEEIAAVALHLCSDEASYVSGQVFVVDGPAKG